MQTYNIFRAAVAGRQLHICYLPASTPQEPRHYLAPDLDDINSFIRADGHHTTIEELLRTDEAAAHARISDYLDALAALDYERSLQVAFAPYLLPTAAAHAAFLSDPSYIAGAL